jgi:hypothetical protein
VSAEQARTIVHWIQSGLVAGLKKSTRQRQNTILTERPVRLFGSKAVRIVIGLFNDRLKKKIGCTDSPNNISANIFPAHFKPSHFQTVCTFHKPVEKIAQSNSVANEGMVC